MSATTAHPLFSEDDRKTILSQIDEVLCTGRLTLGRRVEEFEAAFAQEVGVQYAVAVSSGTAALEIILRILDVRDGVVVVPGNTFIATAAAVIHAGGIPRFVDVDRSLCLDGKLLTEALDESVRAVIVVHVGGNIAATIDQISAACQRKDIPLIEDAAHAHGSKLKGRSAGSVGYAGAFSFYPTKVMTTGEGGMITTNDPDLARRTRILRDQGKTSFHSSEHVELGYNWRLGEINAILGLAQLRRLDSLIERRTELAQIYRSVLEELLDFTPNDRYGQSRNNYYKCIALLPEGVRRDELKSSLFKNFKINLAGEVYGMPCHQQPALRGQRTITPDYMPTTAEVCERHICLPLSATMPASEVATIAKQTCRVLEEWQRRRRDSRTDCGTARRG